MKQRTIEMFGDNRLVSLATAIIAVLAALGTLFAHHRSISALSSKNQAILTQARATDAYNAYEARQIRTNIYRALLATDLVRDAQTKARLEASADSESTSTPELLDRARALEKQAQEDDDRAERILKSYETLQFATTAFEIAIVLVSISAIAGTRIFLPVGCGLTTLGLVLFLIGLFAHT
jgi:Domain of unknown function (DUF4337)